MVDAASRILHFWTRLATLDVYRFKHYVMYTTASHPFYE